MNKLTVYPANMDQETAIRMFLDALHVSYKANEIDADETNHHSASAIISAHLDKTEEQEINKEGMKLYLDDIEDN